MLIRLRAKCSFNGTEMLVTAIDYRAQFNLNLNLNNTFVSITNAAMTLYEIILGIYLNDFCGAIASLKPFTKKVLVTSIRITSHDAEIFYGINQNESCENSIHYLCKKFFKSLLVLNKPNG